MLQTFNTLKIILKHGVKWLFRIKECHTAPDLTEFEFDCLKIVLLPIVNSNLNLNDLFNDITIIITRTEAHKRSNNNL